MKAQGETENNVREHRSPLEYVWGSPQSEKQVENHQSVSRRGRDDQLYGLEISLYPGVWVGEV